MILALDLYEYAYMASVPSRCYELPHTKHPFTECISCRVSDENASHTIMACLDLAINNFANPKNDRRNEKTLELWPVSRSVLIDVCISYVDLLTVPMNWPWHRFECI